MAISQFEGEMSRGCERQLSVDPARRILEMPVKSSLAGVQNRSCSIPIWSCGEPLGQRGARNSMGWVRQTGSPLLIAPPSPPIECPHPAESSDQVCQRPRRGGSRPRVLQSVGAQETKVGTTTFLLIPEQLSLAKDFFFLPQSQKFHFLMTFIRPQSGR